MIITGNREFGLAGALSRHYPDAVYVSRSTGMDLCTNQGHTAFASMVLEHDVIVLCSALYQFNQTVLLDKVHKACVASDHHPLIVAIGSTTDRVKNGKPWLYNAEKKALRDYCNTLSIMGVWSKAPRVTLISFGTLTNNQHKHPDRACMPIDEAADVVKWVIDQPPHLHINELSIDPLQGRG